MLLGHRPVPAEYVSNELGRAAGSGTADSAGCKVHGRFDQRARAAKFAPQGLEGFLCLVGKRFANGRAEFAEEGDGERVGAIEPPRIELDQDEVVGTLERTGFEVMFDEIHGAALARAPGTVDPDHKSFW